MHICMQSIRTTKGEKKGQDRELRRSCRIVRTGVVTWGMGAGVVVGVGGIDKS